MGSGFEKRTCSSELAVNNATAQIKNLSDERRAKNVDGSIKRSEIKTKLLNMSVNEIDKAKLGFGLFARISPQPAIATSKRSMA